MYYQVLTYLLAYLLHTISTIRIVANAALSRSVRSVCTLLLVVISFCQFIYLFS